jgi:hypothetical protein
MAQQHHHGIPSQHLEQRSRAFRDLNTQHHATASVHITTCLANTYSSAMHMQVILNPLHDADEKVTSQGFHQRVVAAARKQALLMGV